MTINNMTKTCKATLLPPGTLNVRAETEAMNAIAAIVNAWNSPNLIIALSSFSASISINFLEAAFLYILDD